MPKIAEYKRNKEFVRRVDKSIGEKDKLVTALSWSIPAFSPRHYTVGLSTAVLASFPPTTPRYLSSLFSILALNLGFRPSLALDVVYYLDPDPSGRPGGTSDSWIFPNHHHNHVLSIRQPSGNRPNQFLFTRRDQLGCAQDRLGHCRLLRGCCTFSMWLHLTFAGTIPSHRFSPFLGA